LKPLSHNETHKGDKSHLCTVCGEGFYLSSDLEDHAKVHEENMRFICTVCGEEFGEVEDFQEHKKTHTESRQISDMSNQQHGDHSNMYEDDKMSKDKSIEQANTFNMFRGKVQDPNVLCENLTGLIASKFDSAMSLESHDFSLPIPLPSLSDVFGCWLSSSVPSDLSIISLTVSF
jgi:uncharacterized Zn-finger protein